MLMCNKRVKVGIKGFLEKGGKEHLHKDSTGRIGTRD